MEFWGVEVKSGEPLKVQPQFGKLIHISQAALGEVKDVEGAKHVPLRLKIDDKNLFLGALSAEEINQLMFDLVFEREFELSHDWKNGSVYFMGYIANDPVSVKCCFKVSLIALIVFPNSDSEDDMDGSFSSEEELPKEQQTKKRSADSPREAPVLNKKAKTSTPNNTGNKKTVHNSIPFPPKKVGKGPSSNKSNEKNKKSNGRMSRLFNVSQIK
ncbi:histone deacetylase HDT1-like [Primulina tabacum]|uniref:histone deacetylase HDT1-like n=1 Tax=Primulina tabacum TaxID=48773 RepID=UPI003F59ECFF